MCLRGSSENLHVVERLSRIDEGDHALGEILRGARLGERETQK